MELKNNAGTSNGYMIQKRKRRLLRKTKVECMMKKPLMTIGVEEKLKSPIDSQIIDLILNIIIYKV